VLAAHRQRDGTLADEVRQGAREVRQVVGGVVPGADVAVVVDRPFGEQRVGPAVVVVEGGREPADPFRAEPSTGLERRLDVQRRPHDGVVGVGAVRVGPGEHRYCPAPVRLQGRVPAFTCG
jgi:hypothetical protein